MLAAQGNGVTVSNLVMNAGTLTFNVSWDRDAMPVALWSDTVWVFVDYNNKGVMERLPLLSGATLTATSPGGKVIEEPDNNQGVWVAGNARSAGSFSATVKLLTAIKDVGGACVYGSNYPPVGEYISPETIKFTGTPPYDLTLNTGTDQAYGNYNLLSGQTLDSFTDKTGAPGIMKCIPMTVAGDIDFSMSSSIVASWQSASFAVTQHPLTPAASAVIYTWSAPEFTPASLASAYNVAYVATTPDSEGLYPVTLTAHSAGYCDRERTKEVKIWDCRSTAGQIGDGQVCVGNTGGKIGN
jgi:hypothetical protein